jgi:hypothetical protein
MLEQIAPVASTWTSPSTTKSRPSLFSAGAASALLEAVPAQGAAQTSATEHLRMGQCAQWCSPAGNRAIGCNCSVAFKVIAHLSSWQDHAGSGEGASWAPGARSPRVSGLRPAAASRLSCVLSGALPRSVMASGRECAPRGRGRSEPGAQPHAAPPLGAQLAHAGKLGARGMAQAQCLTQQVFASSSHETTATTAGLREGRACCTVAQVMPGRCEHHACRCWASPAPEGDTTVNRALLTTY